MAVAITLEKTRTTRNVIMVSQSKFKYCNRDLEELIELSLNIVQMSPCLVIVFFYYIKEQNDSSTIKI